MVGLRTVTRRGYASMLAAVLAASVAVSAGSPVHALDGPGVDDPAVVVDASTGGTVDILEPAEPAGTDGTSTEASTTSTEPSSTTETDTPDEGDPAAGAGTAEIPENTSSTGETTTGSMTGPEPVTPAASTATHPAGTTLTARLVSDGTGHGTSDACFINTGEGFTAPVDDTSTDGVTCTGDASVYAVDYAVTAGTEPATVNVTITADPAAGRLASEARNMCVTETSGAYTATLNTATDTELNCDYSFPAGTSVAGSWQFGYDILNHADATITTSHPDITVTVNGAPATVNAPALTVVQNPRYDTRLTVADPHPTLVTRDGDTMLAQYDVTIDNYNIGQPVGYTSPKGTYRGHVHSTVTLDLSDLPAGYEVPATLEHVDGHTYRTAASAFTVTIPEPAQTQASYAWTIRIVDVTYTPVTGLTHPANLNGEPEPGLGEPVTYSTYRVGGVNAKAGVTNPNNDWVTLTYNHIPDEELLTKTLRHHSAMTGEPGTVYTYRTTDDALHAGQQFWADLDVASTNHTAGKVTVCDWWRTGWNATSAYGSQYWDETRSPIVQVATMDGWVDSDYTVEFAAHDTATTLTRCGDPSDTAGWYPAPGDVPGGVPSSVRVTFDGPVNLAGNGTEWANINLPFRVGPLGDYPNFVSATTDYATMSIDGRPYSDTISATARVFRPDLWVWPYSQVVHPGWNTLHPGPSTVVPGGEYEYSILNAFTFMNVPEGYATGGEATVRSTISSCVTDLDVGDATVGLTYQGVTVPDASTTIVEEADHGPDGIACTGDDVHGWTIETTFTVDNVPTGDARYGVGAYVSNEYAFTVPDHLPAGATIQGRTTARFVDTAGRARSNSTSDTVTVTRSAIVGQSIVPTAGEVNAGDPARWDASFFNGTGTNLDSAEFITVLPYDGDDRGTVLAGPLTNVTLTGAFNMDMGGVYVTNADPDTIPDDVADPAVSADDPMWCLYGSDSCPTGGDITAVYVHIPVMQAGYTGMLRITADTGGAAPGDTLNASLGVGGATNLTYPVPSAVSAGVTITGTVGVPSVSVSKAATVGGEPVPSGSRIQSGTTVEWSYTVTNTGTEPLTGVNVTDDQGVPVTCPTSTLAPGGSMVCTGEAVLTR